MSTFPCWPDWAVMNPDGTLTLHCAAMLEDEQLLAANAETWGALARMLVLRGCAPNLPRHMLLDFAGEGIVDNYAGVMEVVETKMPAPALTQPWASRAEGEHE